MLYQLFSPFYPIIKVSYPNHIIKPTRQCHRLLLLLINERTKQLQPLFNPFEILIPIICTLLPRSQVTTNKEPGSVLQVEGDPYSAFVSHCIAKTCTDLITVYTVEEGQKFFTDEDNQMNCLESVALDHNVRGPEFVG